MATVTKAIIPVAGWGTRRLPITKAIEKCMLPVGNRPIVDYVVRDCIKAGISDIIFVVNKGSTQLQQYYTDNQALNDYLIEVQKQDMLDLAHPPRNVAFHFVEQNSNGKYGTTIPVALVVPHIKKGESVLVAMGDDFVYNADGSSDLANLVHAVPEGGCGMLSSTVPQDQVSRYGVIDFDEETGGFLRIVEKPSVEQAPSNQINISKYVFNYDMLVRIANHAQLEISGEYQITDPISQAVLDNVVVTVVPSKGEFLDCGNVHGWLHANNLIVEHQR